MSNQDESTTVEINSYSTVVSDLNQLKISILGYASLKKSKRMEFLVFLLKRNLLFFIYFGVPFKTQLALNECLSCRYWWRICLLMSGKEEFIVHIVAGQIILIMAYILLYFKINKNQEPIREPILKRTQKFTLQIVKHVVLMIDWC